VTSLISLPAMYALQLRVARGYQIIAGTAAEVAVMAAARLYQRLLVFPSLITMRTIVLGLACVAVAAAFLPLPGNTQVACSSIDV